MNIAQIANNIQQLVISLNKDTFIYDFLLAYGLPKSSISRLQKGGMNLSNIAGEVAWKKKIFFKEVQDEDLHDLLKRIKENKKSLKHDPRFIIVTDYITLLAYDIKTSDTLDIPILEIDKHFDFFLPLAGMEKAQVQLENPADVKAAEKMAKLYGEISKDNPTTNQAEVHNLNVFLSRLLFCFFAEDTGIFDKGLFTSNISSHTQQDGSDLNTYLDKLFKVLNTDSNKRKDLPAYLEIFPYVNGGLFRNTHHAPIFSRRSRQTLIDSGELDWSAIHPDIFGSMIQAVITPEHRGGLGMHYTSVPNIMKVIKPLFLDELYEEFEAAKYIPNKLHKLLDRISKIKIFDPACGSGNFLIIAYKELRLLEIKILQQLQTLQQYAIGYEPHQLELIPKAQLTLAASYQHQMFSRIELSQFYGIELDDFAHEVAILSLWLAQHQMNMMFKEIFGTANPTLPLQAGGNIIHGNATRVNWVEVCPKIEGDEIYILGNPPYLGGKSQSKIQKEDMEIVFNGIQNYKELDYIASWFLLAANFTKELNSARFAFVTTSSINQGAQVNQLWPLIYSSNLEICFAYHPFPWSNNAKSNAGVSVSIIGIGHKSLNKKIIYSGSHKYTVENINSYILAARDVIISQRLNLLSNLPQMITGNSPYDNNNLRFDEDFKLFIENKYPQVKSLIKITIGADELLNDIYKYCFWITNEQLELAESIPEIKERIEKTRAFRIDGGDVARGIANRSHQFRYTHTAKKHQIIIPIVSSERREYIPIGFTDNNSVVISSAAAIYDPELYIFSIISSKIHNCWLRLTSGKLDSRIRYLSALSWNTFPFPEINQEQKQELERHAYAVLGERENHSEKTLAQLYDPDKMPEGLREAHHQLDLAVERCYRSKPFESDEERLEYLFKLYEQMIADEKEKNGELNFEPVKTKKNKK